MGYDETSPKRFSCNVLKCVLHGSLRDDEPAQPTAKIFWRVLPASGTTCLTLRRKLPAKDSDRKCPLGSGRELENEAKMLSLCPGRGRRFAPHRGEWENQRARATDDGRSRCGHGAHADG